MPMRRSPLLVSLIQITPSPDGEWPHLVMKWTPHTQRTFTANVWCYAGMPRYTAYGCAMDHVSCPQSVKQIPSHLTPHSCSLGWSLTI